MKFVFLLVAWTVLSYLFFGWVSGVIGIIFMFLVAKLFTTIMERDIMSFVDTNGGTKHSTFVDDEDDGWD